VKPQLLSEDGVLAKVTAARGLRPVAGPRAPGGLARAVDARGNPWAVAVVRELDTDGLKILFRTAKGRRLLVACLDRAPSAVLAAARRLWVDLLDAEALERLPPAPAPAPAWEADARDHSATGDRLFALRDYEKALLHYRKAAEQDPAAAVGLLEEVGAYLSGHPAGYLRHWRQQGQRPIGKLNGLVGDTDDPSLQQAGGKLGIGGQVQVGEENLTGP